MSNLALRVEPIDVVISYSIFEKPYLKDEFRKALLDVWSFEIFKPMLDLCATKCMQKSLVFKVSNKRFFELDEGNCKTITTPIGGFLNKFKIKKNFEISIKKIETSVIVHEIAHMVEQACNLDIVEEFTKIIAHEIQNASRSKSMVQNAVKQVMVSELKAYPKNSVPSELFARIYQLLAQSKEIYGFSQDFAFSYKSVAESFAGSIKWLQKNIDPRVNALNVEEVVEGSRKYLKTSEERETTKWTTKRIKSFHKKTSGRKSSKWSSNISSIHDHDF